MTFQNSKIEKDRFIEEFKKRSGTPRTKVRGPFLLYNSSSRNPIADSKVPSRGSIAFPPSYHRRTSRCFVAGIPRLKPGEFCRGIKFFFGFKKAELIEADHQGQGYGHLFCKHGHDRCYQGAAIIKSPIARGL